MIQANNGKIYACVGLTLLIVLALVAIIGTSCSIRSYSKATIAITGILEDVKSSPNCSIELCVGGNGYRIYKDNRYSKRSFGILDNMPLGTLENILHDKIGEKVQIEYVQVEKKPNIVKLSIDGNDYVSKDVAICDFVEYANTSRRIWEIVMCVAVILLLLIWRGIIH